MSKSVGKKAFTNNPYLGMVIDALDSDVIADELFRVGMAYYEGAYMLPKDTDRALSYFKNIRMVCVMSPVSVWLKM